MTMTTKATHTPVDKIYGKHSGGSRGRIEPRDFSWIAVVDVKHPGLAEPIVEEICRRHNAHADLLAACKVALGTIAGIMTDYQSTRSWTGKTDTPYDAIRDQLYAAIAQAEGD